MSGVIIPVTYVLYTHAVKGSSHGTPNGNSYSVSREKSVKGGLKD